MTALAVLTASPAGAADAPFSADAVFALPDHRYVFDDCADARKFSDAAAMNGLAALSASDTVTGANAFLACYRKRRLEPDPDQMRYLALAAAAALYAAAGKSSGDTSVALFEAADSIGEQLGAPTPDRSTVVDKVEVGTSAFGKSTASVEQQMTNAQDSSLVSHSGPPHTTYVIKRDPFGGSHLAKYGELAEAMRLAIAVRLEEIARRQASFDKLRTTGEASGAGSSPGAATSPAPRTSPAPGPSSAP